MSGNWFSDGKNQWLARTLWAAAKDLPEEEVSIEKLLQQEEMQRYLDAELDYPIILAPDGHITDGWHRILKARALGHKTIKVKKLAYMPLPDGGPGARKMTKTIRCERRCEIQVNGEWFPIALKDVKKGMILRMFEPDGTLVDGDEAVVAFGDAYQMGDTWGVRVDGSKAEKAKRDQLAKEVEEWDNGSRNLGGFVDAPEAATPQAPVCLNLVDVDVVKHPGWPVRLPLKVHDYMMLKEQLDALPTHEETGLLGTMEDLWNRLSNYEQEMIERLLKRKP